MRLEEMSKDIEVTLPKLGESIMNATVIQWFKQEGEAIGKDEPLLEVATDKVNSEIPSPVAGTLKKILAKPEQDLEVGELLAIISTEGAAIKEAPPPKTGPAQTKEEGETKKDYYSPALLRIARENNIPLDELQKVKGTGEGGRITKKDLEAYVETKKKPCPLKVEKGEGKQIKISGMRKAIAENLVRSYREIPHATLVSEVDVTGIMKTIKEEKEAFRQKHGAKLTITAFLARAIAKTLPEYPLLNASVHEDTILTKPSVNLGIAVSVEQGILVPVIRSCEKKTLAQIAKEISELAGKARSNSLSPDDVQEGTITLTNFGMSGIQIGIPIIRHPEVAIIGIGGITRKVVPLDDDLFAIRQIANISLTFDHRVIDGMYGCAFLASLKNYLETELEIDS